MPFFIPIAIGVAVVGAATVGVVSAAVKRKADRKKHQRADAHPKEAERKSKTKWDSSAQSPQRPQQQQAQNVWPQRESAGQKVVKPEQRGASDEDVQRPRQQRSESAARPQRQDEYHLVAEHLANGLVRTRCGKSMGKELVHGPGHLPCAQCYQASKRSHKR